MRNDFRVDAFMTPDLPVTIFRVVTSSVLSNDMFEITFLPRIKGEERIFAGPKRWFHILWANRTRETSK